MSYVTLTEHSQDPDEKNRDGHYTPTTIDAHRAGVRVIRSRDARGDPTVTVESATLSMTALWREANAALDEWAYERRVAALEPDATKGHALREKKRAAGRQSGQARRAKNERLRDDVATLRRKHPEIGHSQLALSLFTKHGRRRNGDPVKDLRALAKRIARLDSTQK